MGTAVDEADTVDDRDGLEAMLFAWSRSLHAMTVASSRPFGPLTIERNPWPRSRGVSAWRLRSWWGDRRSGAEALRNGQGDTFLAKLILAGDESRDCTRSDHVSPWIEAASRGIGFRAVGNEPGWFVEVGKGESPSLHATLDYGDRKITVARAQPAGLGFSGKTADGTTIVLNVQRNRCQDGMSGEAFEATAQLIVGDTTYRGCGAFLVD